MRKAATYHTNYRLPSLTGRGWGWVSWVCCILLLLVACRREPELHLFPTEETKWFKLPVIDLNLEVVWNYETAAGMNYDWKSEWYYGWDDEDRRLFGELGYTEPTEFCLRRYYTSNVPKGPHTSVRAHTVTSNPFVAQYNWGFWDLLAWNNIHTIDGVQSLIFNEEATLDSVTAYTNQTMHPSRYNAPRYSHSFYEPEQLFAAYEQGIEINKSLDGFKYDYDRMLYVKELTMTLEPVTYIYLTQVILRHNNGRVTAVDGNANLSGMARSAVVNTGKAGCDPVTVYYHVNMKKNCPLVPFGTPADDPRRHTAERADIIGGRLVTFGMCQQTPCKISQACDVTDKNRHYMDVTMQFSNGTDSTFVFDVTRQVRERWKGGVITVELDMDTIPIPSRRGGSGFDAVVKEVEDGGTFVFDI